jgi:hypothetical protein
MALLPRNVPAEGVPEKESGRTERVRRYEITVEREFVLLRSGPDQRRLLSCPECGHEVAMLQPDEVAEAASISPLAVYQWILERRVHFIEAGPGKVFVCADSVQALQQINELSRGETL